MTMLKKKKAVVWLLLVDMIEATLRSVCKIQPFSNKTVGYAASQVALYRKCNRV